MKLAGMLLIVLALAGSAMAQVGVPEIDTQSLGSGIVLASGLLMVLRGRKK